MSSTRLGSNTYEEIVDGVVGALFGQQGCTDWDRFLAFSDFIHGYIEVDQTSISSIMRRLLYAIGTRRRVGRLVGIGSAVGYAMVWLAGPVEDNRWTRVDCVDINERACAIARRNLAPLEYGDRLNVYADDGLEYVRRNKDRINLLYLDIDHPINRKHGYADIAVRALKTMPSGSVLLAHDPFVPVFERDFDRFREQLGASNRVERTNDLKVDDCGLSVTILR